MDIKLLKLLKDINRNDTFLNLLKCNIIDLDDIVDMAIESENAEIIYCVLKYIKSMNDDTLLLFIRNKYCDDNCKLEYENLASIERKKYIEKLSSAILSTEDEFYITLFFNHIGNVIYFETVDNYEKIIEQNRLKKIRDSKFNEMIYYAMNGKVDELRENRKLYQNILSSFTECKTKSRVKILKED